MKQTTLERRNVLRTAGAAGVAAVAGLAASQPAMADDDDHGGLVGSWLVTHVEDTPGPDGRGQAVVVLGAGGTLVSVEVNPPTGVGAGTWRRTGEDGAFRALFLVGVPPMNGQPGVVVEIRPRGRLRGNRIMGTFTIKVTDAATGAVLDRHTGTFEGTRLMA
ncbi:MAG TPA: twin-arginine translocation signal domain-containing protein [Intrasporangium sp.]|uniref:twin-arginine translocation signal domain-containing protein n=1 Tax=Intrasporangium sp. TaxID=1925024 RepID=UPI002D777B02|nr:twin-arginine translocation signal domain-containing protein [Intrasporangium sp.]HET7399355.1 twin-arginine translocation signal domain-containing protein [Intrasporangium sp.]